MHGRLDPLSGAVDAGVGAGGADNGIGGGDDSLGLLENAFEGAAEIPAANGIEPGGIGMTVDGIVGDLVILGDQGGAVPVDEGFLDGAAVGVAADTALALVTGGIDWRGPFGRQCDLRVNGAARRFAAPSGRFGFTPLGFGRNRPFGAGRRHLGFAFGRLGPANSSGVPGTHFDRLVQREEFGGNNDEGSSESVEVTHIIC